MVAAYSSRAGDGRISCTLCSHVTHKAYNMRVHLEGKHKLSSGYSCDTCQVVKTTSHLLHQHKKVCGLNMSY